MVLADRFDLHYTDSDGQKKRPIIIHRSSVGCLERTMAFLTEYYAGAFPLWLAPVQLRLLSISDKLNDFTESVYQKFHQAGIRVEKDVRNESLGKKLREGRLMRIPYLAIMGYKEMENNQLTIRNRETGEQQTYDIEHVINTLILDDKKKNLELSL
jgi:threonyl-tRNA synthetase